MLGKFGNLCVAKSALGLIGVQSDRVQSLADRLDLMAFNTQVLKLRIEKKKAYRRQSKQFIYLSHFVSLDLTWLGCLMSSSLGCRQVSMRPLLLSIFHTKIYTRGAVTNATFSREVDLCRVQSISSGIVLQPSPDTSPPGCRNTRR
jgi:hypothetical protein